MKKNKNLIFTIALIFSVIIGINNVKANSKICKYENMLNTWNTATLEYTDEAKYIFKDSDGNKYDIDYYNSPNDCPKYIEFRNYEAKINNDPLDNEYTWKAITNYFEEVKSNSNNNNNNNDDETITLGFDCNDPKINELMHLVKRIYNLLKYLTPLLLVILGSIDFFRATISGTAEEMDKNKKRFFTRLGIAAIIFLLFSVFQLITNILGNAGVGGNDSWLQCWNSLWIIR